MSTFVESLPDEFVANTIALCGDRGRQWLDGLPALISQLEDRWQMTAGRCFDGIEYNYVAPATAANGDEVVLKLGIPQKDIEIFGEAKYLRTLNGRNAVQLIREDRDAQAILIERAMPGKALTEVFDADAAGAVQPAAELLRCIVQPTPRDNADVIELDTWFENLRRAAGTEFEPYATKALNIYGRLAGDTERSGYLHGDFHPGNIVLSGERFVVIDPKGIVGHIGYEVAVFLLNYYRWQTDHPDLEHLLAAAVDRFAATLDIEPVQIRQWAYAQTVLSAWWTFDEMPNLYDNEVANANIWDV